MNEQENGLHELRTIRVRRETLEPPGTPSPALQTRSPQANIFLNNSLLSLHSSIDEGQREGENLLDDDSIDEALANRPRRFYPEPNLTLLFEKIYEYFRKMLAFGLFVYTLVLIFSNGGLCRNGIGSLAKKPVSKGV
jgi:hypothetical protein